MSTKKYPSVDYVRQCVRYEDGRLFWLSRPRDHFGDAGSYAMFNSRCPGKEAGVLVPVGPKPKGPSQRQPERWVVTIGNTKFYRHLIVWALHHGEWPSHGLDHENRDSTDDRIGNLRPATQSQNRANSIVNWNKGNRLKGVFWDNRRNKWYAKLGKAYIAGSSSDNPEESHRYYLKAARDKYGEFAHGG